MSQRTGRWRGDGSIVAIRSGLGSSHQIILIFSIGFALLSTYTAPGPRLIVLVLSFVERRYLSPGCYSYFAHVCYYHTRLATIISTLDRLVFQEVCIFLCARPISSAKQAARELD